jgi:hypothetical protein
MRGSASGAERSSVMKDAGSSAPVVSLSAQDRASSSAGGRPRRSRYWRSTSRVTDANGAHRPPRIELRGELALGSRKAGADDGAVVAARRLSAGLIGVADDQAHGRVLSIGRRISKCR